MKSLRLGFAVAGVMLAGVAVAQAQTVVKVGYVPFGAPTTFIDSKTNLATGALADLVSAIAKDAGFTVEFHPELNSDMIQALNAKIVDMSVGGSIYTSQNQALIDLSNTIYTTGEALVVNKSDTTVYNSWDDFKGQTIGAPAGSIYVDPLQKSGLFKEVKLYGGGPAAVAGLVAGEIKGYFTTAANAQTVVAQNTDLQVAKSYQPKISIVAAFGFRKGQDDLVKKVNASLAKLKSDGTIKTIFTKYDAGYLLN